MKKYHRITRQIVFSYFVRVLIFIFTPLLAVLLTRNLSVEQYGIYSLLSIIVLVSATLLDLGLFQFIMTKLSGAKIRARTVSFFSIVVFDVAFIIAVLLVFTLTPLEKIFLYSLNLSAYAAEFRICLLIVFFSVIVKLYTSYLAADKRLELANFYEFISSSFWAVILLFAFLLFKRLDLQIVLYSWLLGFLISILLYLISTRKDLAYFIKSRTGFDRNAVKKALRFSMPLVVVHVGGWLLTVVDRFALNNYWGAESVGLYSLPYSLLSITYIFAATTANIIYPYFAEAWHKKANHGILFNASLKYGLIVLIPSLLLFLALKTQIITLISGQKYIQSADIVPWLALVPFLSFLVYLIYQFSITSDRTKAAGVIYVLGLLLNITLNILLVPKYSFYGSAVAAIASYLLILVILFFICRRELIINYKFIRVWRIAAASLIMAIIVYLINPQAALMKILSIVFGMALYVALIFLFKVFVRQELEIIRHFLKKMRIISK